MLCTGWRGHPNNSDFPCKVTIREALKKAFKKQEFSPNPTRLGTLRDPTSHGAQGVPSAFSGLVGPARPAGVITPTVWRTSWTQPHSCSHLSTRDCHPRFAEQGLQKGNSGEWMTYLGLLLLQPHSLNRKGPWNKLLPPQGPSETRISELPSLTGGAVASPPASADVTQVFKVTFKSTSTSLGIFFTNNFTNCKQKLVNEPVL